MTLDNHADRTVSAPATYYSILPYQLSKVGYGPTFVITATGNQGSIPEESEKRLPHPGEGSRRKLPIPDTGGSDEATIQDLTRPCNWNEYILKLLTSIHWRASLVPAAAVIPAPTVYTKSVAVEKLVVDLRCSRSVAGRYRLRSPRLRFSVGVLTECRRCREVYFEKLECSKQVRILNSVAWNNGIGPRFYLLVFGARGMIKRDRRGRPYSAVRGNS